MLSQFKHISVDPLNVVSKQKNINDIAFSYISRQLSTEDYIEESNKLTSIDALRALSVKLMSEYGFNILGAGAFFGSFERAKFSFFCHGNSDWVNLYRNELITTDPLIFKCMDATAPFYWDTRKDNFSLMKKSCIFSNAIHGHRVNNFFVVPIQDKSTYVSCLRFGHEGDGKPSSNDLENSLPTITYISLHLYEAFKRLISLNLESNEKINLSRREEEVLKWIASGKTSWQTAEILHISENTILAHMKKIHSKLDVCSRQHAVAKAINLGLLRL